MAINIYSKAKIVKKDDIYYFMVKSGAKNCWFAPYQTIIDDDLRDKRTGGGRAIEWEIVAHGDKQNAENIALTRWNAPTSNIYGRIDFGDGLNIALWFFKNIKKAIDYISLDDMQAFNFDSLLNRYKERELSNWKIDLANISDEQAFSSKEKYCGKEFYIDGNGKVYGGFLFWQLNNL